MADFSWTKTVHPDTRTVTTSGNGATFDVSSAKGGLFEIDITAASGTTPTLVARVQINIDGTNWIDLDSTNAVTASLSTTGQAVIRVYPGLTNTAAGTANAVLPALARLAWVVGGTTPSFTFATHVALIP